MIRPMNWCPFKTLPDTQGSTPLQFRQRPRQRLQHVVLRRLRADRQLLHRPDDPHAPGQSCATARWSMRRSTSVLLLGQPFLSDPKQGEGGHEDHDPQKHAALIPAERLATRRSNRRPDCRRGWPSRASWGSPRKARTRHAVAADAVEHDAQRPGDAHENDHSQ